MSANMMMTRQNLGSLGCDQTPKCGARPIADYVAVGAASDQPNPIGLVGLAIAGGAAWFLFKNEGANFKKLRRTLGV